MSRNLIERYWAAQDPYDAAALSEMRHPTWSADWPQSAERIPSHAADVAIHSSYPGYPAHRLERLAGSDEIWRALPSPIPSRPVQISGASDIWVAEVRLEYPDDGPWDAIMSLELRDGLVGHETVYYCRVADSPPWAGSFPEQMPSGVPAITASMEHDQAVELRHQHAYHAYAELAATDPMSAVQLLFHATAVVDRPQAGRRVVGLADIAEALEVRGALPGQIRRVIGSGDVLVTESRLIVADTPWFLVGILEFSGDRVGRAVEYLAEGYEPPDQRRPWVERVEDRPGA